MIWKNTLYLGDCLEIMPTIPAGSVDMVFADLPYGMSHQAWDSIIPFDQLWIHYRRVCKENAAMVFTATQPFTSMMVMSNIKMFRYEWIFQKTRATQFLKSKERPLGSHENVLVFYRKLPTYNPVMTPGKPDNRVAKIRVSLDGFYGEGKPRIFADGRLRHPKTVITIKSEQGQKMNHPTQKPVALAEYFIRTYTNPDDVVLDNVMGSGTTCVAAIRTGRKYIGIEIEPEYFDIAEERVANAPVPLPGME